MKAQVFTRSSAGGGHFAIPVRYYLALLDTDDATPPRKMPTTLPSPRLGVRDYVTVLDNARATRRCRERLETWTAIANAYNDGLMAWNDLRNAVHEFEEREKPN